MLFEKENWNLAEKTTMHLEWTTIHLGFFIYCSAASPQAPDCRDPSVLPVFLVIWLAWKKDYLLFSKRNWHFLINIQPYWTSWSIDTWEKTPVCCGEKSGAFLLHDTLLPRPRSRSRSRSHVLVTTLSWLVWSQSLCQHETRLHTAVWSHPPHLHSYVVNTCLQDLSHLQSKLISAVAFLYF